MAGNALKRQRSDSPALPTPPLDLHPPLEKVEDLWFKDGNLVIQSADNHCFKVYSGILERYSSVFSDLITQSTEIFDGVRLIRIDENYEDMEILLAVFFEPKFVFFLYTCPCTHSQQYSFIKLFQSRMLRK